MKVLGIIPAKGDSRGLPRKNLAELVGKPLVAHTIDVALEAYSLDRVIVSTEDREVGTVARRFGAEVPFYDPPDSLPTGLQFNS